MFGVRIGPSSPFVALRGNFVPLWAATLFLAGCSFLGAEVTVDARNDSDFEMRIQVVEGIGPQARPFGPPHVLEPLEERAVELAVPGGEWMVTVDGARTFDSTDAAGRTGRLPVTLILPAPDDPIGQPHWRAPADWAGTGP